MYAISFSFTLCLYVIYMVAGLTVVYNIQPDNNDNYDNNENNTT
jgi:hypothetical protein